MSHFNTIAAIILVFFGSAHSEPYYFTLETVQDFVRFGFKCTVDLNRRESCELKSASHPSQLPSYFPERFKNMSWSPELGKEIFYVEGNGSETRFTLTANDRLPQAEVIMVKSATYYCESGNGFGIWKGLEPQQWWYPGCDPDFTGEWITRQKGPVDAFANMIQIVVNNNQLNVLTVFTSIKILLDPIPNKVDEIRSPEDFTRLRFSMSTPDGVIRNVASGTELPDYFPETFRTLSVNEGGTIMWLEVDETLPLRRHRFGYYPDLPANEWGGRPTPSGIIIRTTGRSEPAFRSSFGYGPHIVGSTTNIYTNFTLRYENDNNGWGISDNKLMYLYHFVDHDSIGLFAHNNHVNEFAVFTKITISYYYWEPEIEITTTPATTTTPTTTTRPTTTMRTTTTRRTTTTPTPTTSGPTTTEYVELTTTTESTTTSETTTIFIPWTTENHSSIKTINAVAIIFSVVSLLIAR